SGAEFISDSRYTVRLEGAAHRGHRMVLVGGTVDPDVIKHLGQNYLEEVEAACAAKLAASKIDRSLYELYPRIYGFNGVLGQIESRYRQATAHELAVVYEVIGRSKEVAMTVAKSLRSLFLHHEFAGRRCTEGNFALPFSPAELDGGPA